MDNSVLKKRLSTFKSSSGKLSGVSDEVIVDVVRAWESWPGTSKDLYRELGLSKMQLVILIKKGKRLIKSGAFSEGEFKEIKVQQASSSFSSGNGIVLKWKKDKLIRFSQVDQLVEFLNKVKVAA